MDQVKVVIAQIKKYHFWAICAAMLFVAFSVWGKESLTLDNLYKTRKMTLTNTMKKLDDITHQVEPPNEKLTQAIAGTVQNDGSRRTRQAQGLREQDLGIPLQRATAAKSLAGRADRRLHQTKNRPGDARQAH